MKFDVLNRWSGRLQFSAEIDCALDTTNGVRVGLAIRWAIAHDADLRGAVLSDADLRGADLRGAVLSGAVLSGADLRDADLSGAVLSGADLSGAVLRGAVLSGAVLSDAVLRGAVLSGADLSGAVLSGADLSGAVLSGAVLSGADLRDADLSGVPIIPEIHAAVYAAASQPGALDMSQWHCGTAHCRAGWVVTLAGDGGAALEFAMGTSAAAALIYLASDPTLDRVPDFYCDNATALADMASRAGIAQTKAE